MLKNFPIFDISQMCKIKFPEIDKVSREYHLKNDNKSESLKS